MGQFLREQWGTATSVFVPSLQVRSNQVLTELLGTQRLAKVYVALITALALVTASKGLASWQLAESSHFVTYLVIAILASALKLSLPITNRALPVSSLMILLGIAQLRLSQTLILACCSFLAQYLRQPRGRKRPFTSLMALLSEMAAIGLAYSLFHWQGWTPYIHPIVRCALAACCYFLTNALSGAMVNSLTAEEPLDKLWQGRDLLACRFPVIGAVLVAMLSEAGALFGWQMALSAMLGIYLTYHFRGWGRLGTEKAHAEQMAALHLRTIEALALAIEAKDHTTHDHLRRVQVYAMEVGKELDLSELELNALCAGALLHDIGKLAVPEHIISKPGRLTPEEFDKMKVHPIVGAEILERVEFPYPVVPIVAAHHEKWDGSGYPCGLKGEQIPIGARILSAVDCLDALATDRQYRRAIPLDQAMDVLVSEAGKAFDPQVVEILRRRYVELEQMAKGQPGSSLSTGCVVECGAAPAAGFEGGSEVNHTRGSKPIDFLTAIAAARHEAQILFEMAQNLGTSLSLNETLSVMAVRMEEIIPYDGLAVYLKEGKALKPAFVTGDDRRLFSALEIPLGEGLSGWVAENRKPVVNGNPSVEPGYLNDPARYSNLKSALAVPLEGIDGVIGVLTLYHAQKDAFNRDHLRILLAISSKLALSIENNLKYRIAKDSATIDYLTGLLNVRSLFVRLESEVSRCQREGSSLTVLACDLDGFKRVNDRFGHLEGNRILRLVAEALKQICRDYDCVARMGGDEFVIVLPGVPTETVDSMIERFCAATSEIGWSLAGEEILSISVGKAVLPKDGCEAEVLLAEADRQMYKSKRRNKLRHNANSSTASLSRALTRNSAPTDEHVCDLPSRPDILLNLGTTAIARLRAGVPVRQIE